MTDKDFGLKLESATPAVDWPASGVDGDEVGKMVCFHFPTMAQSPAATLPSFISSNINNKLYKKRGHEKGDLQYIQQKQGTQFPKD